MAYDIYAVGNALVDLEFQVTDAELQQLGIDKARMTLIDAERRLDLLHRMNDHQPRRTGGGSAGNTVVALQQLGGQAFFSCRVADDAFGRFYADDLHAHGVHSNVHTVRHEGHSGTCLVMITPDAERTMSTHLGVSAELGTTELNEMAIDACRTYYMEGYLAASPTGLEAALQGRAAAQRCGAQLALTLSDVSMIQFCRAGLEAMLGDGVDVLFANEDEIKAWFNTDDLGVALTAAPTLAPTVCVTVGPKGAVILDNGLRIDVAAPAVRAVDTNGAGDMFAGAFLYARSRDADAKRAAELATRAASAVVAQPGNRLPTATLTALRDAWQLA
jgi:sugar/nucleoside kinase (ribokinase family)